MSNSDPSIDQLVLDYDSQPLGKSRIVHADCFQWLSRLNKNTLHAIVTDPPYGVREYDADQLAKRERGQGGIWRIPPSFDGHQRAPLPRFTAMDRRQRDRLREFFAEWSQLATRALRPGGHVMIATNAFLAPLLYAALELGGLEFRGELIRLVRTLRGGDRPKNAEQQFSEVTSLPRGCYEPWGIFRKPLERGMRVSDCLSEFETGGLRRYLDGRPFEDVIASERTPRRERDIARHPSTKPQSLLRRLVYAALPLGRGLIADPFMGSGSTIAAAEAIGAISIGVERHPGFFEAAKRAIPQLSDLRVAEVDALVG